MDEEDKTVYTCAGIPGNCVCDNEIAYADCDCFTGTDSIQLKQKGPHKPDCYFNLCRDDEWRCHVCRLLFQCADPRCKMTILIAPSAFQDTTRTEYRCADHVRHCYLSVCENFTSARLEHCSEHKDLEYPPCSGCNNDDLANDHRKLRDHKMINHDAENKLFFCRPCNFAKKKSEIAPDPRYFDEDDIGKGGVDVKYTPYRRYLACMECKEPVTCKYYITSKDHGVSAFCLDCLTPCSGTCGKLVIPRKKCNPCSICKAKEVKPVKATKKAKAKKTKKVSKR